MVKHQGSIGVGRDGDPSYVLDTISEHGDAVFTDGVSAHAVCVSGDTTHALTSIGADASEDGTGRGTPIVAVNLLQDPVTDTQYSPTLGKGGESGCASVGVAYPSSAGTTTAFDERGRSAARTLEFKREVAYSLTTHHNGHQKNIQSGMIVRRLTPVECLRLQALPDDWLDLELPLSNSAKYRLIGNAGVTWCVWWILDRLRHALEIVPCEGGDAE